MMDRYYPPHPRPTLPYLARRVDGRRRHRPIALGHFAVRTENPRAESEKYKGMGPALTRRRPIMMMMLIARLGASEVKYYDRHASSGPGPGARGGRADGMQS